MGHDDDAGINHTTRAPVTPDTSIADFVKLLGGRRESTPDLQELKTRVYNALFNGLTRYYPNVTKLRDLDQFRNEGMIHNLGTLPHFGPQSGEYLNAVFREYGIDPIPWRPSSPRYRRHLR